MPTSVFVLVLLLVLDAASASPNEQKEIQDFYRRGLAGDQDAVNQCIDKLEAVLKIEPANQLARVYLGSAYTLRSRDLGFGPKKLSTLKRGIAVMDDAVAAVPDDPKVRLTRALTAEACPRSSVSAPPAEKISAGSRNWPRPSRRGLKKATCRLCITTPDWPQRLRVINPTPLLYGRKRSSIPPIRLWSRKRARSWQPHSGGL